MSHLDHGSGKLDPREASRQSIGNGQQNAFNMAIGINNHAFEDCGFLAGILGGWDAERIASNVGNVKTFELASDSRLLH